MRSLSDHDDLRLARVRVQQRAGHVASGSSASDRLLAGRQVDPDQPRRC